MRTLGEAAVPSHQLAALPRHRPTSRHAARADPPQLLRLRLHEVRAVVRGLAAEQHARGRH